MVTRGMHLKPEMTPGRRIKMKITLDNFSGIKKRIARDGIKKVNYDAGGNAISFTMKNEDTVFELDSINFKNLKSAELARVIKKPVP